MDVAKHLLASLPLSAPLHPAPGHGVPWPAPRRLRSVGSIPTKVPKMVADNPGSLSGNSSGTSAKVSDNPESTRTGRGKP